MKAYDSATDKTRIPFIAGRYLITTPNGYDYLGACLWARFYTVRRAKD